MLDGSVRLFDAVGGEPLGPALAHGDDVITIAVDPAGTRLAAACKDGIGHLWDVATRERLAMLRGHERWHPNPDFYYQPGGGPMFDMGPYYLTCLINLLGPVARVSGAA